MKENVENDKKIIGIQVDKSLEAALLDVASEYGSNLSGVVRMILIDYLRRYKGYKPAKKGK